LIDEHRNPPKNIAHNFYFTTAQLEKCWICRELAPHYFPVIVLEAAQIWQVLAPQYFWADCFGGSSNLVGTGSTLSSSELFLEAAQIWRELAPHYIPADCFGGSSDLARTGSTLFSG
jgi:hypothetical protein